MFPYRFKKELEKRYNQIKDEVVTYTDYINFDILMVIGDDLNGFAPNIAEDGEIYTYKMITKKDLLEKGVSEEWINQKIEIHIKKEKFQNLKRKLKSKSKKEDKNFTFLSNVKDKPYSDARTLIEERKKRKPFITMKTLLAYKGEYCGSCYFNTKEVIKKRALLVRGKKDSLMKSSQDKYGKYKTLYLNNKKVRRSTLALFGTKKDLNS